MKHYLPSLYVLAAFVAGCSGSPSAGVASPTSEPAGQPKSLSFEASPGAPGAIVDACASAPSAAAGAATAGGSSGAAEDSRPLGTLVPTALAMRGTLHFLDEGTGKLPDFDKVPSQGAVYANSLQVKPRSFDQGFPGITDRFEWFALDYKGVLVAEAPGEYKFELESDDGSVLLIDGQVVINNDGVHGSSRVGGSATLSPGVHRIEVRYFQGPRYGIALMLDWQPVGATAMQPFNTRASNMGQVAVKPGATRVTLSGDVLFATGAHALTPDAAFVLESVLATAIEPRPAARITIEGHTDDVGSGADNVALSRRRAASVADWFAGHGVAGQRIEKAGYGEKHPRVPNTSPQNQQQNRRVEIVIEGC